MYSILIYILTLYYRTFLYIIKNVHYEQQLWRILLIMQAGPVFDYVYKVCNVYFQYNRIGRRRIQW